VNTGPVPTHRIGKRDRIELSAASITMIHVHDRIHVGDMSACSLTATTGAHVHACKSPCHQVAVGYRGSLPSNHPNYLVFQRDRHLFLNLIDPRVPLFKVESFRAFRMFAAEHWHSGQELVIHCNQGESRAPSLALVFMAHDVAVLPSGSFDEAKRAFLLLYPSYRPGQGISTFLTRSWHEL
jgi:hypothetical protein